MKDWLCDDAMMTSSLIVQRTMLLGICDATAWKVVSNLFVIAFIYGNIHGLSCKNLSHNHWNSPEIVNCDWRTQFLRKRLTHWGRVTHICARKLTIIVLDNGLSPGRHQAIIWTNVGILLIGPLATNLNEILIEIYIFLFKKNFD